MTDLLTVLRQADSAFPSGSFGFSNGIEPLAARGQINDRETLTQHMVHLLRHRWGCADRVALARAHRAGVDLREVSQIDRAFEAANACEPLRRGSSQNGKAYLTSHARLGTPNVDRYRHLVLRGEAPGHLPVAQGMVLRSLGIEEKTSVAMSLYTAAASMSQAAVRLGVVGALDAQRSLGESLAVVSELALPPAASHELFSFTPVTEIVTVQLERADVRLFAN